MEGSGSAYSPIRSWQGGAARLFAVDDVSIYSQGEKLGGDGILQTLDKVAASGGHFLERAGGKG